MFAGTRICSLSLVVGCIMMSCAPTPNGGDVVSDIQSYAYQNQPRFLDEGTTVAAFKAGIDGATIASSDVPWRVPATCRAAYRRWLQNLKTAPVIGGQDTFLSKGLCPDKPSNGFVGVAISGGGNKSAVYAAEVLFELKRYGLSDEIDVVSSVSGGSFIAAIFGLSCDPKSECDGANAWRPKWDYKYIRDKMETNYLWSFFGQRIRPDNLAKNILEHHGADDDLASVIGKRLLDEDDHELTFKDFNPTRPNLILNATNVTRSRPDFDTNAAIPEKDKRVLSEDEALHFSFTQQYFWRLLSDLDTYPVNRAITASAAFPLIIDRPSLRQYSPEEVEAIRGNRNPIGRPKYIALFDGGVHDNYGVTELRWIIECKLGVPDTVSKVSDSFYRRECGASKSSKASRPPPAALIFGVNSSLIRSEGSLDDVPKQRGLDSRLLPVRIKGTADSVDMIMDASGELRKQQLRELMRNANSIPSRPGYQPYDSGNPEKTYGPYQYVDLNLESAQILDCKSSDPNNPGMIDRRGRYTGGALSDRLLGAEVGESDKTRCAALAGVLQWNDEIGPKGRNLQLPTLKEDFCLGPNDCQELLPLIGNSDLLKKYVSDRVTNDIDLSRVFFDPANTSTPRLLKSTLLFDAVRDVSTNFTLEARYAWLLRYTARWVVAHRIWELCTYNGPLVKVIGKYNEVCIKPLPKRELVDDVGSDAFKRAGL
jgi:hypothetical protein